MGLQVLLFPIINRNPAPKKVLEKSQAMEVKKNDLRTSLKLFINRLPDRTGESDEAKLEKRFNCRIPDKPLLILETKPPANQRSHHTVSPRVIKQHVGSIKLISCDGVEFRTVLKDNCSKSGLLSAMMQTPFLERQRNRIVFKQLDAVTVESIASFLNGEFNLVHSNTFELLVAADYLCIDELSDILVTYLARHAWDIEEFGDLPTNLIQRILDQCDIHVFIMMERAIANSIALSASQRALLVKQLFQRHQKSEAIGSHVDFILSRKCKWESFQVFKELKQFGNSIETCSIGNESVLRSNFRNFLKCLPKLKSLHLSRLQGRSVFTALRDIKDHDFTFITCLDLNISNSNIDDEAIQSIASSMYQAEGPSYGLESLNLSDCAVGHLGARTIADYIQSRNQSISALDISRNPQINFVAFKSLFRAFEKVRFLTRINVASTNCDVNMLLGHLVISISPLTVLNASDNNTTVSSKIFTAFLRSTPELTVLSLNGNDCSEDSLFSELRYSKIEILNLSNTALTTPGAKSLSQNIPVSLRTLDVSRNHLPSAGTSYLAGCMRYVSNMDISYNSINISVAVSIGIHITDSTNSLVMNVGVAHERIRFQGCNALCKALKTKSNSLISMNLCGHGIVCQGAKNLASLIAGGHLLSLRSLVLMENNIKEPGAQAFQDLCVSKLTIDLRRNPIPESAKRLLVQTTHLICY